MKDFFKHDVYIVTIYDKNLKDRIDFKRCCTLESVLFTIRHFMELYSENRWCSIEIDRKRDDM